ncbi:MAG: hypothetical protein KBD01_06020 [Acidobacteria bacterium]|nr:hypothetical protein [Acidobacteriota bacterium]
MSTTQERGAGPYDELPIPLWQMLAQEYEAFHGIAPDCGADIPFDRFTREDIPDPAGVRRALDTVPRECLERVEGAFAGPDEAEGFARLMLALLQVHYDEFVRCSLVTTDVHASRLARMRVAPEDELRRRRLVIEHAFSGLVRTVDAQRLQRVIGALHQARHAALCLSGGGVRSATFSLGLLQALARYPTGADGSDGARRTFGLLGDFHYLSTVSGGGYIGSWLSGWIHRAGLAQVQRALGAPVAPGTASARRARPLSHEALPIRHLRRFSNYLTPRRGLMSADTWTLLATYIRNLFVNWTVLLPLLFVVVMLPRLWLHALAMVPPEGAVGWPQRMALAVAALTAAIALVYAGLVRPSASDTTWDFVSDLFGRLKGGRAFLWLVLLPLLTSAVALCTFRAWTDLSGDWYLPAVALGTAVHTTAFVVYNVRLWRADRGRWQARSAAVLREALAVIGSGAIAGPLGLWFARHILPDPQGGRAWAPEFYVTLAVPAFIAGFLAVTTIFIALTSRLTSDADREWWARSSAWAMIAACAWIGLAGVSLLGPNLVLASGGFATKALAAIGGISGLATALLSAGSKTGHGAQALVGFAQKARQFGVMAAAVLFVLALTIALSLAARAAIGWLEPHAARFAPGLGAARFIVTAALAAGALAMSLVASRLIRLREFSMHALYRDRLLRCYLGASNTERRANPFTGFDPRDNIQMAELRVAASDGGASRPAGRARLLPVVNVALNLVRGRELAWQRRKASSFTITPLHAGNASLGYRPLERYRGNGVTLGTAMTISGAAANPSMGYHSSPFVSFLMTLLNVRLGAWMPNTGLYGSRSWRQPHASVSVGPLLQEAFGLTDDTRRFVHLSDGGHFDNLGVYEMVLRRCRLIVACDASADPKFVFQDLGDTIQKIRVDLGISIEFGRLPIYRREDERPAPRSRRYWAIGRIRYSRVDGPHVRDGVLLYVKPTLCDREPRDILHYAGTHPAYPHESTADQWFDEAQFECYRALGAHVLDSVFDPDDTPRTLREFARRLEEYVKRGRPTPEEAWLERALR